MDYCTDCGTALNDDDLFCPNCGTAVDNDDSGRSSDDTADVEGAYVESDGEKTALSIVVAAAVVGLIPGALLAWGFGTIGGSGIVFLLGWIGSAVYLRNKRLVSEVVGSGLYISALILPLVPILFYVPNLFADPDTASEAGAFVGSFIGMFVYGVIFAIVGVVLAAIGYVLKRHAAKKLNTA
ncbi:zinc-ribbon domain-containing protein (plasmid) [Halobacterium salinarum]|uniref:zinc-ribbon domain-containing protein n=1 Tax=Halobacterium salinarum TaxID=2242 RepID=UPI0030D4A394